MKLTQTIVSTLILFSAQFALAQAKDISEEEAKKIALGKVAGEVKEVERETHKGQDIFSVEILKDGKKFEVLIEPKTGKVIKVEEDHDDDEHEDHSEAKTK